MIYVPALASTAQNTSINTQITYIWASWCNAAVSNYTITTGAAYTTNVIWANWVQGAYTTGSSNNVQIYNQSVSQDQIAQILVNTEAERVRHLKAKVIRDEADARAKSLLRRFLSDRQREQYDKHKFFEIESKDGARLYRINEGWAGNVQVLNKQGRVIEKLCIHPKQSMPVGDNLLAQKLLLESDEEQFRKIANITRLAA